MLALRSRLPLPSALRSRMLSVSRSGLKRVFIGTTAERVLDALPCDVLVVKPAHFASRVEHRSRGMRVVPPQPLRPMPL